MQKLFNKILIPVDFSAASTRVVEKAATVAMERTCSIHLLYVMPVNIPVMDGHFFFPMAVTKNTTAIDKRFERMIARIKRVHEDLDIRYSIEFGFWNAAVIDYVNNNGFDMVIIGQRRGKASQRQMFLNPDKIAARTNVAVITVPVNKRISKLYSIVIPVTDFLPVRKIKYAIYMASAYQTTIKLLGIKNARTEDVLDHYMSKADHFIRSYKVNSIESVVVHNENIADAVNIFSAKHAADMVIVNPGKQTRLPGFLSALTGKIFQKYASMPVLTINPV